MVSVALALSTLVFMSPEEYLEGHLPPNYWRSPRQCGPNCLYAYLALHGKSTTLDAIAARVLVGNDGANMADLRKAASGLGLPSRVVKSSVDRLGDWQLPAIAHLHTRSGHFVLLLQATPESVTIGDMNNGQINTIVLDRFSELWSGYLLVPGSARGGWWPFLVFCAAACGGIALYRWKRIVLQFATAKKTSVT